MVCSSFSSRPSCSGWTGWLPLSAAQHQVLYCQDLTTPMAELQSFQCKVITNWLKSSVPTQLSDFTLMCMKDFHTFISTLCWHGAMVSSKTSRVSRQQSQQCEWQSTLQTDSLQLPFCLCLSVTLGYAWSCWTNSISNMSKSHTPPHSPSFLKFIFWLVFYWFSDMDHQHPSTARWSNAASTCNGQTLPYINTLHKSLK